MHELQVESEDSRQPFWELRTSEEATHFWEREFDSVKTGLPNPQEPQSPAAKSPFISNERDIHVGNFFLGKRSVHAAKDVPCVAPCGGPPEGQQGRM